MQFLSVHGYSLKHVDGDGDCFFHAVSVSLFGTQCRECALFLRTVAAQYLADGNHWAQASVEATHGLVDALSITDRMPASWAHSGQSVAAEMVVAIAALLQINIVVYTPSTSSERPLQLSLSSQHGTVSVGSVPTVHLLCWHGHYEPIIPLNAVALLSGSQHWHCAHPQQPPSGQSHSYPSAIGLVSVATQTQYVGLESTKKTSAKKRWRMKKRASSLATALRFGHLGSVGCSPRHPSPPLQPAAPSAQVKLPSQRVSCVAMPPPQDQCTREASAAFSRSTTIVSIVSATSSIATVASSTVAICLKCRAFFTIYSATTTATPTHADTLDGQYRLYSRSRLVVDPASAGSAILSVWLRFVSTCRDAQRPIARVRFRRDGIGSGGKRGTRWVGSYHGGWPSCACRTCAPNIAIAIIIAVVPTTTEYRRSRCSATNTATAANSATGFASITTIPRPKFMRTATSTAGG